MCQANTLPMCTFDLEDLLMGSPNPQQNAAIFGLLFEEIPTYEELNFGTPKLACLFKLNEEYNASKSLSVNVFKQIRTHFKESC